MEKILSINDDITKFNYEKLLLSFIKRIENGELDDNEKKGNEGSAYIIDNNFVVKELRVVSGEINEYMYENYFSKYCEELENYASLGYKVPKIYAWLSLPTPERRARCSFPVRSYYILEERIKGRELYYPQIDYFYENFQDEFSFEEYKNIFKFGINAPAFNRIFSSYLTDFDLMNKCLESLSESEIERFITEAFMIYANSKYAQPDLFSVNVFLDGGTLWQIDQKFENKEKSKDQLFEKRGDFMIKSIINMFIYNAQPRDYLNDVKSSCFDQVNLDFPGFELLIENNEKDCTVAISKFIRAINRCLDNPNITDKKILKDMRNILVRMIGIENTNTIFNEINFE